MSIEGAKMNIEHDAERAEGLKMRSEWALNVIESLVGLK